MIVVDSKQMKKIDQYAINNLKIPALCLVERAALAVLKNIDTKVRNNFAIISSIGNNGADGLALARNLLALNKNVEIYIIGNIDKATDEFMINLNSCKKMTDKVLIVETIEDLENMENNLKEVTTIVDAIFGTGLNRSISGIYSYVIALINRSLKYTISIDLPSGLDASTGEKWGELVDSDLIISMQLMKKGLYIKEELKKKTIIEDIGIPQMAIDHVLNEK